MLKKISKLIENWVEISFFRRSVSVRILLYTFIQSFKVTRNRNVHRIVSQRIDMSICICLLTCSVYYSLFNIRKFQITKMNAFSQSLSHFQLAPSLMIMITMVIWALSPSILTLIVDCYYNGGLYFRRFPTSACSWGCSSSSTPSSGCNSSATWSSSSSPSSPSFTSSIKLFYVQVMDPLTAIERHNNFRHIFQSLLVLFR